MSNAADVIQAIVDAEKKVAGRVEVLALLETLEDFIDDGARIDEVKTRVAQSRACNTLVLAADKRMLTDARAAYARYLKEEVK